MSSPIPLQTSNRSDPLVALPELDETHEERSSPWIIRFNLTFLFIWLGIWAVFAVGVHHLHEYQMRRLADTLLTRAEEARKTGDLQETSKYISEYLALRPDDSEQIHELALIRIDEAKTVREKIAAYLMCEGILRREPRREDIRRKTVDLALGGGRFSEAIRHLDYLIRKNPEDVELRRLHGFCCEKLGQYEKAEQDYELVIQQFPHDLGLYIRLGNILRDDLDQGSAADFLIDKMVSNNSQSYEARLARARHLRERKFAKEAAIDVETAYQMAPNEPEVLVAVSEILADQRGHSSGGLRFDLQDVQSRIAEQLDKKAGDVPLIQAWAQLETLKGRPDLAAARVEQALHEKPGDLQLRSLMADLLISQGEMGKAKDEVLRLREQGADAELLKLFQARLSMLEGNWHAAVQTLQSIQVTVRGRSNLRNTVNLCLGTCYQKIGHHYRELTAYQRAVDGDPLSGSARIGYAAALEKTGQLEEALFHYRQVKEWPGVSIAIARLESLRNLQLAEDERDWKQVEVDLNAAAGDPGNLVSVLLLRADMMLSRKDFEEAKNILESGIRRHPRDASLPVALASVARQEGDSAEALRILDEAERRMGLVPQLFLGRIEYFAFLGGIAGRAGLLELAKRRDRYFRTPLEQFQALRDLAAGHEQMGDLANAQRLWQEISEASPNDLGAHRRLLQFALEMQADAEIRQEIAELKRLEGDGGVYWRLGEAMRLMIQARKGSLVSLRDVRDLLDDVEREMNRSSALGIARAELAELEGNPNAAIEQYHAAIVYGNRSPAVILRLVTLLKQQRRYHEIQDILDRTQQVATGTLQLLAAEASLQTDNVPSALEHIRQFLVSSRGNYLNQLRLGQLELLQGKEEEAGRNFRQAMEMEPTRPEPWVFLVSFLSQTEQKEQVLKAIEQMRDAVSPEDVTLTLAQCYEACGRLPEAAKNFQKAFEEDPGNPNTLASVANFYVRQGAAGQAMPLLRKLLDSKLNTPPAMKWSARRSLALGLASQQPASYVRFQEALDLIEDNLEATRKLSSRAEGATEDLLIKAQLLASRSELRSKRQAIVILQSLDQQNRIGPAEQFQLLQLYVGVDRWMEARSLITSLLRMRSDNVDYLVFGLRAMFSHGEFSGLGQYYLEKLVQKEPHSLRCLDLQARALIAANNIPNAKERLKEHLQSKSEDQHYDVYLVAIATLFADLSEELERVGRTRSARLRSGSGVAVSAIRQAFPRWDLGLCAVSPSAAADRRSVQDLWNRLECRPRRRSRQSLCGTGPDPAAGSPPNRTNAAATGNRDSKQ